MSQGAGTPQCVCALSSAMEANQQSVLLRLREAPSEVGWGGERTEMSVLCLGPCQAPGSKSDGRKKEGNEKNHN